MTPPNHRELHITATGITLPAFLDRPADPKGLVLFVHGSGSSRFSPRNQQIARTLNDAGLATLLFDLLSESEQETDRDDARFRFDIDLLSDRLMKVLDWVSQQPDLASLPLGLFGASTGAAAAMVAAARYPRQVHAVVTRGGRVDLARYALRGVRAPVLMIVGGLDREVYRSSRQASRYLPGHYELRLVPGASHLFEEPGKLEDVARVATAWFERWLAQETPEFATEVTESNTEKQA